MNLRDRFALRFGEDNAEKVVLAALEHDEGRMVKHNDHSDFRWALLTVIGWQCIELYADYHEITITWNEFKEWLKQNKNEFNDYTGDLDYLSLFCGRYNFIFEEGMQ